MAFRIHPLLEPKKGSFLLAQAYLGDPNFERSVVLLTEHNGDGSLGFVVNRQASVSLNQILPDFPPLSAPVFMGGPVEKDHLFYLHNKGDLIPKSQKIRRGLYWGGEYSALKELVAQGLVGPNDIHFYLGYSGWSIGQLESEVKMHSWEVIDVASIGLNELRNAQLWTAMLRDTGTEAAYWHTAPEDPQWN